MRREIDFRFLVLYAHLGLAVPEHIRTGIRGYFARDLLEEDCAGAGLRMLH